MSPILARNGLFSILLFSCALLASPAQVVEAGDPCVDSSECDDTFFCNGEEQCVDLVCVPGTPIDCSPLDDQCNDGVCDDGVDACVKQPANEAGPCNDTLFCTVNDVCTFGTCGGAPRDCSQLDDQCNVGVCDDGSDACVKQPDNEAGPCIDGLFCTVNDVCTSGTCGGAPRDCSDGIACSTDTCDEGLDQCFSTAAPNCPDCSGDGVPDLCIGPQSNDNWSADIWDLPFGEFPDSIGHFPGLFVELPNTLSIFLDTDVAIDGLAVRNGGTLLATQVSAGDLTITPGTGGGILNKGTIFVANDNALFVLDGSFAVSGQGKYLAQPGIGLGTTTSLSATDISLTFTACGIKPEMIISDAMTVTTTVGDFVLDGRGVLACAAAGRNAASLGGKTPPILKVREPTAVLAQGGASAATGGASGQLNIAGSFVMLEGAEVCVGCNANANTVPASIFVNGNFDNQSVLPSFFRWPSGKLHFPAGAHTFEVAGLDLGPASQGFGTAVDTLFDADAHTNFSVASIVVPTGSDVIFRNTFANTAGTSLGDEALYVRKLSLATGSGITVDGCTVYYCELEDNGAAFVFLNGGALVAADCGIPTVSTWGMIILTVLLLSVGTVIAKRRSECSST